jgi:hypothetical protein
MWIDGPNHEVPDVFDPREVIDIAGEKIFFGGLVGIVYLIAVENFS